MPPTGQRWQAARDRLTVVAAETRPVREVVDQAKQRLDQHTPHQQTLASRLRSAGWRERRSLRRDLADTDHLVDAATHRLHGLETDAAPALDAYRKAVNDYRTAEYRCHDELRGTISLAPLERIAADKVGALITWQDWATGRHVDIHVLLDTARTRRHPAAKAMKLAHMITLDPDTAERLHDREPGRSVDNLVDLAL